MNTRPPAGFTLIEILVAIVIVGILTALALPGLAAVRERARSVACTAKIRELGSGVRLYGQDHDGDFPRSFHSAGAHGEPGWAVSIAPYLGAPEVGSLEEWRPVFQRLFRCPCDNSTDPTVYSYGMNVFFELSPDGDDYEGSPATWRKSAQIPKSSRTVLLAETRPVAFGDHFMCHQWSGIAAAKNAVAHSRHLKKSNYLFVDGHVENLPVESTFNPAGAVNLWNPSKAR